MMNVQNLTIEALQTVARGFGLPVESIEPNMLYTIVGQLMGQNAQNQAQPEQKPAQQAVHNVDPFAQVMNQKVNTQPVNEYAIPTRGYVSEKLIKFCVDMHKRFNLDTKHLHNQDYTYIRKVTDELSNRPLPASQKQIETIHSLVQQLNEMGVEISVSEEVIDGLTGGAEGTASQVVDMLFRKRTEAEKFGPCTDKQAETFVKWMFCPDIPWENFDVQLKVALQIEDKPGAWRFMTPEEFTAEVKSKIVKADASKFIDDHGHLYYAWQKTRITQYQIDTIRQLEERMMNMHSVGVREYALVDGVVVEQYRQVKRQYAPQGYKPMTEVEIKQLSTTDASKFIEQMRYELNNKEKSAVNIDDTAQQDLEDKRNGLAKDELHAVNVEHQNLIDVIFKLEAAIGQENEELHESVNELMIQRKGSAVEVGNKIKEFMEDVMDTQLLTFSALVSISQNSTVATNIIQMIDPAKYEVVLFGTKNEEHNVSKVEEVVVENKVQAFMDSLK